MWSIQRPLLLDLTLAISIPAYVLVTNALCRIYAILSRGRSPDNIRSFRSLSLVLCIVSHPITRPFGAVCFPLLTNTWI